MVKNISRYFPLMHAYKVMKNELRCTLGCAAKHLSFLHGSHFNLSYIILYEPFIHYGHRKIIIEEHFRIYQDFRKGSFVKVYSYESFANV
jgi:hypothetical protein